MQDFFRLRPVEAAEVSEISELTATAQVRPEERVDFHIGNPVRDPRLIGLYKRMVLGLGAHDLAAGMEELVKEHASSALQADRVLWFLDLVDKSVAYLPRGGFPRKNPGPAARAVHRLITKQTEEPLDYDLGDVTGKRELTFVSGGKYEALRVLFFALARQFEAGEPEILVYRFHFPYDVATAARVRLDWLPEDETELIARLKKAFDDAPDRPRFLLLGGIPREVVRREIRRTCLERPLFVIEANGAPNPLSLAREAGLAERVLRILEMAEIRRELEGVSLAVVLGRADYVEAVEKAHFELKGTPSAPEIEFLAYLLENPTNPTKGERLEGDVVGMKGMAGFPANGEPGFVKQALGLTERLGRRASSLANCLVARERWPVPRSGWKLSLSVAGEDVAVDLASSTLDDAFSGLRPIDVIDQLFRRYSDQSWRESVLQAFLSAFLQVYPYYQPDASLVVSGSARTALGILGHHCGITDVIVPDLSWTYHHCFPRVLAVPLTADFQLDVVGILSAVDSKLEEDERWAERGGVVLNSPHNATGKIFREADLRELLRELLLRGVWVIDDLAYKGVAPADGEVRTPALREIANEMLNRGELRDDHLRKLVTVHSLSKTDCFAGARLAVVEILDPALRSRFEAVLRPILPNVVSALLAYLFHRNGERLRTFWALRNRVLRERSEALREGCSEVPEERNSYGARVVLPEGGMYPRLEIEKLPAGVSLGRIAKGMASRGMGLIPLSTFARTAQGYQLARKAFRLTLGGDGPAPALARKIRRVVIDLNRIIEHEAEAYNRRRLPNVDRPSRENRFSRAWEREIERLERTLAQRCRLVFRKFQREIGETGGSGGLEDFVERMYPDRFTWIRQRLQDRAAFLDEASWIARADRSSVLTRFEQELRFPSLEERKREFRARLFDRTVHPTQMYALEVERTVNRISRELRERGEIPEYLVDRLARSLVREYLGLNVAIRSPEEAWEAIVDLDALIEAEDAARWYHGVDLPLTLSFWGDWDGSTRPSGQGHRLVAGVLLENLGRLWSLVRKLHKFGVELQLPEGLAKELRGLEEQSREFWKLLDEITRLTSQLEQRYRSVLPIDKPPSGWRRVGMRLGLARDPVTVLWLHNDRLERKMLKLRARRRDGLSRYFELNYELHRAVRASLDAIAKHSGRPEVAAELALYRGLLRRFFLTPRIHQRMVLASDQFAVNTTVHNLVEINSLAGRSGFPGMVLGLQVSMSTDPEAVIVLDRKLRAKSEEVLRGQPDLSLPSIWIIPLFENLETLQELENYLDRLWDYAIQSRRLGQDASDRFAELICELFVAGSDLSQQIGQAAGLGLYREARYRALRWLADRRLVGQVRIKLGSGEPVQRQGGYYDPEGGGSVTISPKCSVYRLLSRRFSEVEQEMLRRARGPLRGALAGGEFRTFQSNLFEKLRLVSAEERAQFLFHVRESQRHYEEELRRAASSLLDTRYTHRERGLQELSMLALGRRDERLEQFLKTVPEHFRQILYGTEEDVVGIHVISYFVSRTLPPLRDRPVVRPGRHALEGKEREIVDRIVQTLPLAKHGSLLRAIGHNRAQTMVLGVNQLTTGLFRALKSLVQSYGNPAEGWRVVEDSILPHLQVYDILHTLRVYHDLELTYVRRLEDAFPPANSAFLALREDNDAIREFLPALQRELLRRCGLESEGFLEDGRVRPDLLALLKPQLAVLLQRDPFNCDLDVLLSEVSGPVDPEWRRRVASLLQVPVKVREWRAKIWEVIERPVRSQVESFVELAQALHKLTERGVSLESPFSANPSEVLRLGAQIAGLLRGTADDTMRQFLIATVQYLTELPKGMTGVPVEVVRALRDVERIIRIEEQALSGKEQACVRFYVLQIARLCGENG